MANDTAQNDEEAFRRLLQSVIVDTVPPPGCEDRLRERLIARIRSQGDEPAEGNGASARRVWILSAASAAVATVIAVSVTWWLIGGGVRTASADFAEVLIRIRQARTVAYDTILRAPGQAETKVRVFMAYPGRARVAWPNGKVSIFDHVQRKCLTLNPEMKRATLVGLPTGGDYADPLENLRKAEASAGRFAATETLDGRAIDVYEVIQPGGVMKVSVDSRQQLPIRIEVRTRVRGGEEEITILTNFAWNQPMSDSLFSLAVPAGGYALVDTTGDQPEDSLIDLLRACAQMGQGLFPPKLDAETALDLVLKCYGQHAGDPVYTNVAPTIRDIDDEAKGIYGACLRGLAFVEKVNKNGSWRYVGQGVRLGDGAAGVCWWRPPGSASCRVVFGDLQVRDVPTEALPLPRKPQSGSKPAERRQQDK